MTVVEIVLVHAEVRQKVVGDGTVDVLSDEVERHEHDPTPREDPEIDLANHSLLLLESPLKRGIESVSVFVLGRIVKLTPVVGDFFVLENMVSAERCDAIVGQRFGLTIACRGPCVFLTCLLVFVSVARRNGAMTSASLDDVNGSVGSADGDWWRVLGKAWKRTHC